MWACLLVIALAARAHGLSRALLYQHSGRDIAQLQPGNEIASSEIPLLVPVVLYGETYNTIFVNNHGIISFRTDIATFLNAEFPLSYPAIAALYTNVDTSAAGAVRFQETQDEADLRRADAEVADNFPDHADFRAKSVFLATWLDVGYHRAGADKLNTFQIVIINNGTESFVQLLYPEDGVRWIQSVPQQSGLPDARAQAGFMSEDGRYYELRGSGTHLVRNLPAWSNTDMPGKYIFRVGNLPPGSNVELPFTYKRDTEIDDEYKSCSQTRASVCHMNAKCIDYQSGICCQCDADFYGNGKTCVKIDVPLRVNGKLTGELNSVPLGDLDLQSYVVVVEGRTYTAVSQVPESVGYNMLSLDVLGGVIGWLFAKPEGDALNGYQLTGAVFNHTAEIHFPATGEKVSVRQQFFGHDVFDQVTLEANVRGSVPAFLAGSKIEISPYEDHYTTTEAGVIRSNSKRVFRDKTNALEYEARVSQTFHYDSCRHAPAAETVRPPATLKVAKNFLSFERGGIVRYGMSNKIMPIELDNPCTRGRETCLRHSSCVVEGSSFRCVCELGYTEFYQSTGELACVDLDECATGAHNCDPNAQCHNYEGSFQCSCNGGFEGDGTSCARVPLCRNYPCDPNAYCHETTAGPECVCNEGYSGDGRRCWSDERATATTTPRPRAPPSARPAWSAPPPSTRPAWSAPPPGSDCRTLRDCSDYGVCVPDFTDRYFCICGDGYYGNGYACYPREQQVTDRPPATATPPALEYEIVEASCFLGFCSCGSDYEKFTDSRGNAMCRRLILTTEQNPEPTEDDSTMTCTTADQCPNNSDCQFNPHTWKKECRCWEGYAVDSEGECAEEGRHPSGGGGGGSGDCHTCDPHAACVSLAEGYHACVCESGYTGDGSYCRPGSDCRNDSDCEANAACAVNSYTGRRECQCRSGYTKDSNDACVPVQTCNGAVCPEHASCLFDPDNEIDYCQCDAGYEGEGVESCKPVRPTCEVARDCHPDAQCVRDDFTLRYTCICKDGHSGDGYECSRVLPPRTCLTDPTMCSEFATCARRDERLTCECRSGYRGDGVACEPVPRQTGGFLILTTGAFLLRVPFYPTPQDPERPILKSTLPVGLDVDCHTGQMYWGDVNSKVINSAFYDGSYNQVFASRDINSPEGISVDWVSRNIYWTDSYRKTIEVANLDTKIRTTLINTGLGNPRGIAVHPQRGKIFWSDWNRKAPKIEWANMDGSERGVFVPSASLSLPNSLAIDWRTDSLCFADAGLHSIECVNIDTQQRETFSSNNSYPFGIAITDDAFYWTDWKTKKIETVSRSSRARDSIRVSSSGSRMYGMAVAAESCPDLYNVCQRDNGNCPPGHLCLLTGQRGRRCVCANNEEGQPLC